MSEKDPQFTDEMVSAYLDGELSDSERQYVERIVEADPQYRRMLEELRALRDSLKSLPQFQLDDEFHRRVLERAVEQTKLVPATSTVTDGRQVWRRLAWVGGTLAAGLLLMFFLPGVLQRLGTGPLEEVGQVPRGVQDSAEERLPSNTNDPFDAAPLASDFLPADESRLNRASVRDREPEQPRSEAVRQLVTEDVEGLKTRGAQPAPTRSARSLATDDAASDGAVADSPVADDTLTSLARIDTDLDAVVYCAKVAGGSTDALALRSMYRMSGNASELGSDRWGSGDENFGFEGQPQFLFIKGSPEQVALSLSRIELTDSPDGTPELAVKEMMAERGEHDGLGRGRVDAPSDRYRKRDEQEQLRRSSDLYIDLDAADTDPIVIDRVAKESDDYRQLLGFIAAKSPRSLAESNAVDEVEQLNVKPPQHAALNVAKGGLSQTSPDSSAEAKTEAQSFAVRSRMTKRSQAAGGSEVAVYSLTPSIGVQPSKFYYEQAHVGGRVAVPDRRAIVDELKRISPKNEDGTLRVLLVLPSTEIVANTRPHPAAEVAEPANVAPADALPEDDPQ